ncbi:uncharacterized protein LOC133171027 isoform X1 [Syngnathus typhle]|uniref:uncharacterized protein LOC133171027 isoform X1 n=1 Tax=Syngnathus typhle TaxID=161592 RepID=UPI002A6B614F|nr:uncharacterized protein LOC133171027 isoform X1 [Syngnathus typhle]
MWCHLLVLSLLVCSSHASTFLSAVMIYDPSVNNTVVVRSKMTYQNECPDSFWTCQSKNCTPGASRVALTTTNTTCEYDVEIYYNVTQTSKLVLRLSAPVVLQWINVTNNVTEVVAIAHAHTWTRSDTGRANASPRANVLPVLRVASNCQRNVTLPTFDPDGDVVRCRYQNATSVLKLSADCNMFFAPSIDIAEGAYAVQVLMEDFPRQNITLAYGSGSTNLTREDPLSQIPVQFVLIVGPRATSCVDGESLPAFRVPTPANGDHLFASVNQTLKIPISVFGTENQSLSVLFSGPLDMTDRNFELVWTPTEKDLGLSHPVCFVLQTVDFGLITRHSEMRCVIVTVHPVVVTVTARLQSAFPLSADRIDVAQLKAELVLRGLPSDITLKLVSFSETATTTQSSIVP